MATTVQVAAPAHPSRPLVLWHLLSLDAPSVAASWVVFISRSQHVHLPAALPIAMALAVWLLYAADRLLDSRNLWQLHFSADGEFEQRHFFHHAHRRLFSIGIATSAITLIVLLPHLDSAVVRLYFVEGVLLVAWLTMLHAPDSGHSLPKEIAVGIFFSAAVFIPTVARAPGLRACLVGPALLFAALCSINCLFIYAWEHEHLIERAQTPHVTTRMAIGRLPALAVGLGFASTALVFAEPTASGFICIACDLSLVAMLTLHFARHRLSRTHLRAAADLALLTPLVLIPFL